MFIGNWEIGSNTRSKSPIYENSMSGKGQLNTINEVDKWRIN